VPLFVKELCKIDFYRLKSKKISKFARHPNMSTFVNTVTAEVFATTRGISAIPTISLKKVAQIFQESSVGNEFGNPSSGLVDVPADVLTQTCSATVSSDDVVDDIETRWQGWTVSRSDNPSVKLCLFTDFKAEWVELMERGEVEFKNSDGSTVYAPAFVTESPPAFLPGTGEAVYTYYVYRSSTVFTLYYNNGAMMQFIKPNKGVDIVGPKNMDIYTQLFDEIDNEQKLDYLDPGYIVIPCFKVPEQKVSLLDRLSKFPSLFNRDGSFLQKILTDPKSAAHLERFDLTTSLTVDEKGTQFSSMMEADVDIERGGSCKVDFILDSAFLWRIVHTSRADRTNTVLVSGIVTDLD